MKLIDIYDGIKGKFKNRTKLDIAEGSVIDSFILATSYALDDAYKKIEQNKTPHIYTSLKGSDLDSLGILVGCTRNAEESDDDYLFRIMRWNKNNQAANLTAIDNALLGLKYSNNCKYVPLTHGIGTATVYIIPKDLSDETKSKAIMEAKDSVEKVCSAKSYIEYVIPEILYVNIHAYINVSRNSESAKSNIEDNIREYINNIIPGDFMKVGDINRIGINENNVDYFMVSNVIVNDKEVFDTSIIQKLEKKLLFNKIVWNEVD